MAVLKDLLARGNDALAINPPAITGENLSLHGSDWLWAVTAFFILAFLGLLVFCFTSPESDRVFHYLFTIVLMTGSVTYFAAASDLGWDSIHQVDHQGNGTTTTRQIFWVKYVYWVLSFPSAALALGLLSGVSWTTILTNVGASWYWILTYLAGAYTKTSYKWGFFGFGTLAYVILAMSTLNESREAAQLRGIAGDYMLISGWVNLLWVLYPIAWALSDGGNVIGVTPSYIFFGVLDMLMIPVVGFLFVILGRRWDFGKLHLAISEHRYVPA
ncbi:hypothetical protein GGR56DRAFT_245805 [Xylariaceae sp. FL0804]|nr:hypothetical protein GGR56DRAFT_245805 [Xylariaceae sp. FL0804]